MQRLPWRPVLVWLSVWHHRQKRACLCQTANENAIVPTACVPFTLLVTKNIFVNEYASLVCSKCDLDYGSLIYKQPFWSV